METLLVLPFHQDASTVKSFPVGPFCFYINRAKDDGRRWVTSNWRTGCKTVHFFSVAKRMQGGVKYLQLIFFSWWVGVVRKDQARFYAVQPKGVQHEDE